MEIPSIWFWLKKVGGKPQPQARKASGTRSSYRTDDLDDNDDQFETATSRSRPPVNQSSRKPMSGWDDDDDGNMSGTVATRSHRRELGTTGSSSNFKWEEWPLSDVYIYNIWSIWRFYSANSTLRMTALKITRKSTRESWTTMMISVSSEIRSAVFEGHQ